MQATRIDQQAPRYGVLIRCIIEDSPYEGTAAWIDLQQLEDEEHASFLIGEVTGKNSDPYPERWKLWNEDEPFEVAEISGLGPRLASLASDVGGPLVKTLADVAHAIQCLEPQEREPFVSWAEGEGDWWLPGYAPDLGGQTAGDAVWMFRSRTCLP